jgi:glycosyltransferase involved in cell wall biosynthesis
LNKINELKLNKKVFIKGWVDNTIQYIKKSKLFILSSLYEGLGNVLIDSINFKTPCISTNCKSGPSEILLNGKGGFLVKNNNTQELSRTIVQCIKNYDNAKRKNLVAHNSLYRFEMKRNILIYEKFLNKFFYN